MTTWEALIIVALTLVVGSIIYLIIAKTSPEGGRADRTPNISIYLVTGGAMSLLIAFTMSATYGQYTTAQQAAQQEADAVYTMNRAATFMQPQVRDALRNQLVCYADEVVNIEWPLMREGKSAISPQVRSTLTKMDSILAENIHGAGPELDMWEQANSDRLAAHQNRLLVAGDGIPLLLWLLLILGSVITITSLFVYADRSKPGWAHVLLIIGPLFIASAALVVISFFDHPYADTAGAVSPAAMENMKTLLTHTQIADFPLPSCPTGA